MSGQCGTCGVRDVFLMPGRGICVSCWCDEVDAQEGVTYRYFLTEQTGHEEEVDIDRWVSAERGAGFVNTLGHPERPGTAGWSTSIGHYRSGRIERVRPDA